MENAPHVIISGKNIPIEIEERYLKWQDDVYNPLYVKNVGFNGIDRYQRVKKSLVYPDSLTIYHAENRNTFEDAKKNTTRNDLQRDIDTTFYRLEWAWHDVYSLLRSFRNESGSRESSVVENASIIHLEAHKIPGEDQKKFDQWFMRWASRIYIPILMKLPGIKAYNCFGLTDLSMRMPERRRYLEVELPLRASLIYFENMQAFQDYNESLEYAAYRRNMEIEFPGITNTIWDVEYQLVKSWRK